MTIISEKEYEIPLKEHDDAVRLSGDENPLHSIQKYMMGAHLLSLIEIHPEIKNQYIQQLKVGFKNPVLINERGNKIVCEIRKSSETGTHLYTVKIKENNNLVLEGMLQTTDSYDVFKFEAKKKLETQIEQGIDETKIADLKITPDMLKEYQRLIYSKTMNENEYKMKYHESIPSMVTSLFIPAEIIRMLKQSIGDLNTGKKYIYASQELEFYALGASGDLKLIGKKPENLGKKSRCYIDMFVSGLEGIIARSRTLALAYS
jgi:hypothetical protein